MSFPPEGASARAGNQPQAASSQGDAAGARPAVVPILFAAVVTNRLHELALKKEYAHIQSELRQAVHRDSFALFPEWGVTVKSLIARIDQVQPKVVHVSAHGGDFQGAAPAASAGARDVTPATGDHFGIYLSDDDDDEDTLRFVSGGSLAAMIKSAAPGVRMVTLNVCHSDELADALLGVVDCVVGMSGAIGDRAAVLFSSSLYRALGNGRSVGTAFDQAVATLAGLPDEQRPKLRCRAGIDPYQLHLLDTAPAQESLPRPELDAGDATSLLRSPTLRVGLVLTVIALAVFAVGAAAATFWSHETERQTAPPSPSPPARSRPDASRPAAEPVSPEAPMAHARAMPGGAPTEAPGPPPGSKQKRVVASQALPGRAPEPSTSAGPPRQQLTAPTTDAPRHAPTIVTAAGRGSPADELTRDQVRRGVRDAVDLLRGCYEDQLLFTPTLSGTVRAQFLIGIDGRVASATATGLGDAVNFCVAAVIRGLVFPSSDSRVLVNYPLYLRLVRRPHGHRGVTPALQVGVPAVGRLPGQPGGP